MCKLRGSQVCTREISGVFHQYKGSPALTSQKVPVDGTTLQQQGECKIVP